MLREELCHLYSSPSIRVIKSKKQLDGCGIWCLMGGVVREGYWCGNVKEKDPPGRSRRTWEDNIKMIFKIC
jgi:hypothetical protein